MRPEEYDLCCHHDNIHGVRGMLYTVLAVNSHLINREADHTFSARSSKKLTQTFPLSPVFVCGVASCKVPAVQFSESPILDLHIIITYFYSFLISQCTCIHRSVLNTLRMPIDVISGISKSIDVSVVLSLLVCCNC